jgi:hypothetical protein
METTIDVKGLPEDRIEYLKNVVELWKKQAQERLQDDGVGRSSVEPDDDIVFATHRSKVIGPLTRNEIYDYLT